MTIKHQRYGFKSAEELKKNIEKLYGRGLSQQEIASQIGCSRPTLLKAFKEFNIKKTNRNALYFKCGFNSNDEMVDKFRELYGKGLSLREIAIHYDVSKLSVIKCFKKHRIETRSNSESIGILQKDIAILEHECEFIYGMLLGNGSLKRKKYTAYLRYACLHKEAIEFLAQELSRLEANYRYRKSLQREWYEIRTMSYMCLAYIHDQWYTNGKNMPNDFKLTPEACYWWYVGDGDTAPEALKIITGINNIDLLIDKLPVKAVPYMAHNKFPTVYISEPEERIKFLEYIGPCRHRSYSYKWKVYAAGGNVIADRSI